MQEQGTLRRIDTTVAAFSIAGAVNWLSRWYRPEGKLGADEIAKQIADAALHGVLKEEPRRRRGLRAL